MCHTRCQKGFFHTRIKCIGAAAMLMLEPTLQLGFTSLSSECVSNISTSFLISTKSNILLCKYSLPRPWETGNLQGNLLCSSRMASIRQHGVGLAYLRAALGAMVTSTPAHQQGKNSTISYSRQVFCEDDTAWALLILGEFPEPPWQVLLARPLVTFDRKFAPSNSHVTASMPLCIIRSESPSLQFFLVKCSSRFTYNKNQPYF